ncbi:MAG: GDSL-type esterase/lipase family protein [Candidatus Saccharibacteria bacterium]
MSDKRVLVFGDSIAYGAWDTQGGWVDRLKRAAHQQTLESEGQTKVQIINLGIGGDSSTKILARLESEITARYSASWSFILVFSFNANDERTRNAVPETPLDQFNRNTQTIIDIAKKHSDKILFVGTTPTREPEVSLKDAKYSDERIVEYEAAQKAIVEAAGITFVDVRETFESADENVFSYDKIHLNDAGHTLLADLVKPKLEELTE